MIFYIAGLALVVYALKNFKSAFILYLGFKLLLGPNITVISIPGIPLLSLELSLTIMFILLFFVRERAHFKAAEDLPFRLPFTLLFISWGLSAVFGAAGILAESSTFVRVVLESIILVLVIWETIESREDFESWYRVISIVIFISCIYGFIELTLQDNPVLRYEQTLISDPARLTDWFYSSEKRGYRICSFFPHPIGAGINWAMYAVFTLRRWLDEKDKRFPVFPLITALLCIPCILLTRQRTPLVFFIIAALSLIEPKNKKFYILLCLCILGAGIMLPVITANEDLYLSFFSQSAQEAVSGSSLSMRINQHLNALLLAKGSPIVGYGYKFRDVMSGSEVDALLGLEGVWMAAIVEYGALGVIAYAAYALWSVVILPLRYSSLPLMFTALAYWAAASLSSLPGLGEAMYFVILFYFIKGSSRYGKKTD